MKNDSQLYCIAEGYTPFLFVEGAEINKSQLKVLVEGTPRDVAHANELKTFQEGEPIGFFTGERKSSNGTLYYKTRYILLDGRRENSGAFGLGAGKYSNVNVFLWVSSQNITEDINEYYKSLDVKPVPSVKPAVTPVAPTVTPATPKNEDLTKKEKSIFTQTDVTTGEEKPNYLAYGGILLILGLMGVALYYAFGKKEEPLNIPNGQVQYIQSQPMA